MTIRVYVSDLHALAEKWRRFGDQWEDLAKDAVIGALMDGGFVREVSIRVPKSEYARYAANLRGWKIDKDGNPIRTRVELTKSGKLPSNWRKKFGVNAADADRVQDKYGHGTLQKSLLPNGEKSDPFEVKVGSKGSISFRLSSSLVYANRMHETDKPAEGEYWAPGLDRGWSTPRTGNGYLWKSWEKTYERVEKQMVRNIDKILRDMGLM